MTPRPALAQAFEYHAKNARCVWMRSEKGWYPRDVTPEDTKSWKQSAEDYANGTYKTAFKEENSSTQD